MSRLVPGRAYVHETYISLIASIALITHEAFFRRVAARPAHLSVFFVRLTVAQGTFSVTALVYELLSKGINVQNRNHCQSPY